MMGSRSAPIATPGYEKFRRSLNRGADPQFNVLERLWVALIGQIASLIWADVDRVKKDGRLRSSLGQIEDQAAAWKSGKAVRRHPKLLIRHAKAGLPQCR